VPPGTDTARPAPSATSASTSAATGPATRVEGADAGPTACRTNADCPDGGVCNCRCPPGPELCNGPVDACGDCAKRKMVGVCLRDCEGG
jgi:hypothetical protein